MLPPSRPQRERAETRAIPKTNGVADGFALLCVRGYYLTSMGASEKNDHGSLGDAFMLLTSSAYVTLIAIVECGMIRTRRKRIPYVLM